MFLQNRKNYVKIIIVSLVKIDKYTYKLVYFQNRYFENSNYKGYFLEEQIIRNVLLFQKLKFQKEYGAIVDYEGNLQYIFNGKEPINI